MLFLSNSIVVAAFLLSAVLVGYLLLTFCKTKIENHITFFQALVAGSFCIVTVFALWHAGGKTILVGFAIIGLFLIRLKKDWRTSPFSFDVQSLKFALTRYAEVALVGVLVLFYKFLFFNGSLAESVYPDYVLYSKLSEYLLLTGHENTAIDYVLGESSATPYHYFDLWLNSLLLYFSNANKVSLMILSALTVGISITWSGCVALACSYGIRPTILIKSASFFFLFCSGIYLGGVVQVPFIESTGIFTKHVFNYSKLFPIYWLCLLLFIGYKENSSPARLVLVALAFPFVNISTAPGIFLMIGVYLVYLLFTDRKSFVPSTLEAVAIGIFIMLFYLLNGGRESDYSFTFDSFFSVTFLRTAFNIVVGAALQFGLIYSLLLLAVLYHFYQQGRLDLKAILYPLVIYGCFILPWGLFNSSPNSVQLFSNFFVPFTGCLAFVVFCVFLLDMDRRGVQYYLKISLILLLPLIGLIADINERIRMMEWHKPPSQAMVAMKQVIKDLDNPVGVYFRSNYDWASKFTVFGALDQGLQEFVNREKFHTVSLSIFDIPLDTASWNYQYEKGLIKNSVFGKYLKRLGAIDDIHFSPGDGLGLVDYQIKYIQEFNVQYVMAEANYVLPEKIKSKFSRSLILDDYQLVLYY